MRFLSLLLFACLWSAALEVTVKLPARSGGQAWDGRLLLLFSTDGSAEPRFQISDSPKTQIVFGADVEGVLPG
ncbi:MAG: hypothetical protein ACK5ZJ_24710, partial [Acidobacteriota bacterium]